jgi:hypothetical protein
LIAAEFGGKSVEISPTATGRHRSREPGGVSVVSRREAVVCPGCRRRSGSRTLSSLRRGRNRDERQGLAALSGRSRE